MKRLAGLVLALGLTACASIGRAENDPNCPDYSKTAPGFYGGDGTTQEKAVEPVGLDFTAERWIAEHFAGSEVTLQTLVVSPKSHKRYDLMTFKTADGRTLERWFWASGGIECLLGVMK